MRTFQALALVLSLVATAGTSSAKSPKPTKLKSASAMSKKEMGSPAKPTQPAPLPVPAPEPAPAPVLAPAPFEPDPGSAATPMSARAQVDAPVDTDRAAAAAAAAAKPISVAPLLGIAANGLRFGAGLRAGYTLPSNVYLGAGFMYHFGTSTELLGFKVSSSAFYPSAEGGYDIRFGRMVVRPYGGLAVIFSSVSTSSPGLGEVALHSTSAGIYPGCAFTYDVPASSVFVGGDARILFNLDGGSSFGAFGSAGMRF
jgi:hypothetical protein